MKFKNLLIAFITLAYVPSMVASTVYIYNGLYNRTAKVRMSYQNSKPVIIELKKETAQRIKTIDNPNDLKNLKIDVQVNGKQLNNILSERALFKAQELIKQNKEVWINLQDIPGQPEQIGINILSASLRQTE